MRKHIKLNTEHEINIIRMKKLGITNNTIINKYKISENSIYNILKRNGRIHLIGNKKYQVDEKYFEIIDTEEKAYWLGFLYADGNVIIHKEKSGILKLKLKQSDKKHIEKFNQCLGSNYPIKDGMEIVKVKGREYQCCYSVVCIYNTKIVKDLYSLGCMNNKTFKIKFPKFLDDELIRHFIRGYFDGDGCIYKNKNRPDSFVFSIVSVNKNFLEEIANYLNYTNFSKNGKCNILNTYRINDILDIKQLFYENSNIYLQRKKEIFESIIHN